MRPSLALDLKRSAVCKLVGRFRTANPRIFGSVLHGTDQDGSDLDFWLMHYLGQHCLIWVVCKLSWNLYWEFPSIC